MKLAAAYVEVEAKKAKYLTDMASVQRKTEVATRTMQKSWDRIGQAITENAQRARKLGVAIAAAGTVITAALGAMVASATKFGDELDKMSLRTGETVETLSALGFAAQISGSSLGDLENGIRRLSRNMNDFRRGIGESARSFEQLGIDVNDSNGNMRSAVDVMTEVADKMKNLGSESERTAIAQELFGRGGARLLPLLKQGSAGIKELTDRAEELGLVISADAAKAAAVFNDKLTEMRGSLRLTAVQLGMTLIPVLQPLVERLTEIIGRVARWIKEHPKLTKVILTFTAALGTMAVGIGGLIVVVSSLTIALSALIPALKVAIPILISAAPIAVMGSVIIALTIAVIDFTISLYKAVKALREWHAGLITGADLAKILTDQLLKMSLAATPGARPLMQLVKSLFNKDDAEETVKALGAVESAMTRLAKVVKEKTEEIGDAVAKAKAQLKGMAESLRVDVRMLDPQADPFGAQERRTTPFTGRPQVIPEVPATEHVRAAIRELMVDTNNIVANFLAKRRDQRLALARQTAAEEAKVQQSWAERANDLADRDQQRITDNAVKFKQEEIDERQKQETAYNDWLEASAKRNAEQIMRAWSKAVDAVKNFTEEVGRRIEEINAEQRASAQRLADDLTQTFQPLFENLFRNLLDGSEKKLWEQFWDDLKNIAISKMAALFSDQIFQGLLNMNNIEMAGVATPGIAAPGIGQGLLAAGTALALTPTLGPIAPIVGSAIAGGFGRAIPARREMSTPSVQMGAPSVQSGGNVTIQAMHITNQDLANFDIQTMTRQIQQGIGPAMARAAADGVS